MITIANANALHIPLPDQSVQCVVTSPPYWGLRDYGTAKWEGGSAECDHKQTTARHDAGRVNTNGFHGSAADDSDKGSINYRDICPRCGAHRIDAQIGLESTPAEYVAHIVSVMRECWRVLKDDGTLWINLGDSYAGSGKGAWNRDDIQKEVYVPGVTGMKIRNETPVLKPKDLCGIPWLVAKALQVPYYIGRIKDETERAWLAGFIDGEGTISFVERDRGENRTSTHDARIYVTNTDRGPLDYFSDLTAGHVYLHDDGTRENRYGSRPCYRWQMGTHDGALLLRELYPYLRTKRKQAALIWTLYTTLRHQNGHARTPEEIVLKRHDIAEMVRTLNAGGDVVLPEWVEEPPSATEPGWYLRSDIIWHKPNPMPESVTDRPTKSHEYVFLLTKQARYFYDAEAIKEGGVVPEGTRRTIGKPKNGIDRAGSMGRIASGNEAIGFVNVNGLRNRRSVWTIATSPYSGAHFAVWPPKLIEPMILAGTSARGECPHCGKAWVRVVENGLTAHDGETDSAYQEGSTANRLAKLRQAVRERGNEYINNKITIDWRPSCSCPPHEPIPQTVLDPFAGSGTTGQVAVKHGRRAVLLDLNMKYIDLQFERTNGVQVTMQL